MQCIFISIVKYRCYVFAFFYFSFQKNKICSQVIAFAIGLFIKNLIVLLIRKVFMHFNLPSLTWECFLLVVPFLHFVLCLFSTSFAYTISLIWQWNAQLHHQELSESRPSNATRTNSMDKNLILTHSLSFTLSMFTAVYFIAVNFFWLAVSVQTHTHTHIQSQT